MQDVVSVASYKTHKARAGCPGLAISIEDSIENVTVIEP